MQKSDHDLHQRISAFPQQIEDSVITAPQLMSSFTMPPQTGI